MTATDFKRLFESTAAACLVVLPDAPRFTIVAASDRWLRATRTTREAIVDRGLFEILPEDSLLCASLERVIAQRAPDTMLNASSSPIFDEGGKLVCLLHRIEDPTASLGELKFRALFDSMPQLAWTARADGFVDFYNHGWYAYTGKSFEELQGWGWKRLHDPAILPQVMEGWQRSIESGTPFEMEFPLRRKDGVFRWFLTRVNPIRDAGGAIVRWVGINTDIHDRKLARAANDTRLRLLVDGIQDYAVFMLDAEGHVVTWNPGAERLKQYRSDEIIGKHFSIFYPEEDVRAGKCELELEVASRTGRFEEESWRVRKDGTRFWASVVLSAVRDDEQRLVGFAKVTRDLTERKRAEEERLQLAREQQARQVAEAAEQRFRMLAETSAILSSSLEYESTTQSVARIVVPRFADWCAVQVLEGDRLEAVAVAHVDPAKVVLARELLRRWPPDPNAPAGAAEVLRTGRSQLYPEITDELLASGARDADHLRASLELGLRSALVVPLSARGKTLGALTLVSAESARVYTQYDLALMEEVGGRIGVAIDNARLYRAAQEAIRLRDEFLSIASHELRTPLTSLQLQVTGVLRNVKNPTILHPEKLAGRVEVIDRQVDRMTTLVNGLLDVSRAAAGRLQLELAEADLAEVLRDTVDRMKEDLAAARCPLELVTNGPIVAQWDRMRLEQVFTNFITNAMKYGAGKPIEVAAGVRDGKAVVSVRDHGIGVARDDQERIFERFGRAVSSDHYGGLGLGLWIVKELVDSMGGAITLDSDAGKGATFTVTLPCVR